MMYNLAIIGAALVSADVEVLAVGVVVGSALHLAIQLPDLRMAGMAYSFVARWRDAAVREVGKLMAPRIIGLAALQVNFHFVAIYFASRLGEGAISAVNYAWLVVMTPLGIIGIAISTAVFPTLADQAAADEEDMGQTLAQAVRMILYLSLPAGVLLAVLAEPVVVILFQRGQFDAASTALTADALRFYALGLFASTAIEILSRGYYALRNTRTPVAFAVVGMASNIVLTAALVGPLEVRGVAIALSIAATIEALLLYVFLSRRITGIGPATLVSPALRTGLATALMAVAAALALAGIELGVGLDVSEGPGALAACLAAATAAAGVYAAASRALGLSEVDLLLARVPGLRRFVPSGQG
jgi:putative peptidoglycan lipid II flippase